MVETPTIHQIGSSCLCTFNHDWDKKRLGLQEPILKRSSRELLVVTGGYSWNSILARTEALNMIIYYEYTYNVHIIM